MVTKYAYGWHPSRPDFKAKKFSMELDFEANLPPVYDMRPQFPPNYDQLKIGSCVDNAFAGVIHRWYLKTDYKYKFTPARLFSYYNARAIEGTTDSDAGSSMADGFKSINEYGICPESEGDGTTPGWLWEYVDDGVKFKTKPSAICYTNAILHKALKGEQVSLDRATVLNTLAADNPIVFGFTVYDCFESSDMAATGIMEVPGLFNYQIGGHGVVAVGYMLNTPMGNQGVVDWAIVRNSWGTGWGDHGNFYMPLDQILCNSNMASDAWVVDIMAS